MSNSRSLTASIWRKADRWRWDKSGFLTHGLFTHAAFAQQSAQHITGVKIDTVILDENASFSRILGEDARRWATAFEDVLVVGYDFYRHRSDATKRKLEAQFLEAAKNDSAKGRKGKRTVTGRVATSHIRKAAKVVAKRVQYTLEAEEPWHLPNKLRYAGTVTGRTMGGVNPSGHRMIRTRKVDKA